MKQACFIFFLFLSSTMYAQEKENKKVKLSALPFAFFSPETGLALGGLVNANFFIQDTSHRPSTLLLGGAYTFKNQLLLYLPFEFNWRGNKYLVKGELGYYRYFYQYYGVGPEYRNDFEIYTVNFPRLRVFGAYRFFENHYGGIKYNFDDYNIQEVLGGGSLETSRVAGYNGSLVSNLGLLHIYDSRDYIFSARKGWFITTSLEYNGTWTGSDFGFRRISSDIIKYITIKGESILALNLYGGTTFGEAPFQELFLYGGTNKARGYFQGHYRDNAMLLLQSEFRFRVWKRFGAVVFSSIGNVAPRLGDIQISTSKWNGGLGLRFMIDPSNRLNLRIDYAIGRETSGLYITFGEAF